MNVPKKPVIYSSIRVHDRLPLECVAERFRHMFQTSVLSSRYLLYCPDLCCTVQMSVVQSRCLLYGPDCDVEHHSLAFSFVSVRFVLGLELEAWVNRSEEHFAYCNTLVHDQPHTKHYSQAE